MLLLCPKLLEFRLEEKQKIMAPKLEHSSCLLCHSLKLKNSIHPPFKKLNGFRQDEMCQHHRDCGGKKR